MTRKRWMIAILAIWALSLGWLVKREVFRSIGARLAEAALAIPPGALFYRLDVGDQQIGYSSTTIDTVASGSVIRVENVLVLDVPALGKLHRTTARSTTMLSRALRVQSVFVTFDGDLGQFAARGRVIGDTILSVAILSAEDSQVTHIPLEGPITVPALLPLRLAFGGELKSGRSYSARLFDPLLLTGRDVTARIAAESTFVVSDSADLDSTTMRWLPEHFDTVRAFRIDHDANGVPTRSWIDAQGRLVSATTEPGFGTERGAFEIVYENFRNRDTARLARASAVPRLGDIVPLTALAAGVTLNPRPRTRLRLRMNGRDTLEIHQTGALQANAAPYRLPANDTALARWLAPEPLIESNHPQIAAQARQIIRRERGPARVAALLTHWVHRSVQRTIPAGGRAPSALKVLEQKSGDCNEVTTLYVALARAAGLPARTASGLLYVRGRFYYHAWAEIYLNDWIPVDPTFDQFPADAAHLRFAVGGLARQVELIPLIGRLKLEVL
ncbi:MAG TPA: transglutaminase-like domain-containing protein [Gemmatimonadales bacterium]|nr:transglutaminase-like domain-containing protein [Gemmatimonadales bacterium]